MHECLARTMRTLKELGRTLVLALALSVVLFVGSTVVWPALTREATSQRVVLYWAAASPIAGIAVAIAIRAMRQRWPGRAPTGPRSTWALVLTSLA